MINFIKLNDKSISVSINGIVKYFTEPFNASCEDGNYVRMWNTSEDIAVPYSEIQINGVAASSASDTVSRLGDLFASFKPGGGGGSPTPGEGVEPIILPYTTWLINPNSPQDYINNILTPELLKELATNTNRPILTDSFNPQGTSIPASASVYVYDESAGSFYGLLSYVSPGNPYFGTTFLELFRGSTAEDWEVTNLYEEIATVSQLPPPPHQNVQRITPMFTSTSAVDMVVELHDAVDANDVDYIVVRADDTSGVTSDMTIYAAMGFGAKYAKLIPGTTATPDGNGGYNFQNYVIEIVPETDSSQCEIRVPAVCNSIDINYFVGRAGSTPGDVSFFVDTFGTHHPFTFEVTPMSNFCSEDSYVIIEGEFWRKGDIQLIYFGADYDSVTEAPYGFLSYFVNTAEVTLPKNITSFGDNCFASLGQYAGAVIANPEVIANATSIGVGLMNSANIYSRIDLPRMSVMPERTMQYALMQTVSIPSSITEWGNLAFSDSQVVNLYCGSFDAATLLITLEAPIQNTFNSGSYTTRYHNTQSLADAFTVVFPGSAGNNIVIQP